MNSTFGILLTRIRGEGVSFIPYNKKDKKDDLIELSDLIKRLSKKEIEEILLSRDNLELFPALLFILLTINHHITPLGFSRFSIPVKGGTQILIELY
jgi:hypothetical protein